MAVCERKSKTAVCATAGNCIDYKEPCGDHGPTFDFLLSTDPLAASAAVSVFSHFNRTGASRSTAATTPRC